MTIQDIQKIISIEQWSVIDEAMNDIRRECAAALQSQGVAHASALNDQAEANSMASAAISADLSAEKQKSQDVIQSVETDANQRIAAALDRAAKTGEELSVALAEILRLTPPPTPDKLSQMAAAYRAALSPEEQIAFAGAFAIVRILVMSGELDLASGYVASVPVTESLQPAKDRVLAMLAQTS